MLRKILLGAGLCAAVSSGASAAAFDVELDGFCNTFTLTVNGFETYGTRQGCGYTVIDGGTVAKIDHAAWRISNDTNDGSEIFTWYFTPPVKGAGSWYLYETTGSSESEINSGTYSHYKPGAHAPVTRDATGH